MSEEQLRAFLKKAKEDAKLLSNLESAADANEVVALAKEAGFSISLDTLHRAQLSEEQIEELTGGGGTATGIGCMTLLACPSH